MVYFFYTEMGVKMMKKILSLMLAVLMAFSVLGVLASAGDLTKELTIYDTIKHVYDAEDNTCTTIEIMFPRQFTSYDSTKEIKLMTEYGTVAAVCKPNAGSIGKLDLYTEDGTLGVTISTISLYNLVIPEGAYSTDSGVLCDAQTVEYTGVFLTGNEKNYSVSDVGIMNFLAKKYDGNVLYAGNLIVGRSYTDFRPGRKCVTLQKKEKDTFVTVGTYTVESLTKSGAEVVFGEGVEIDKYATYKIKVTYGSFLGKENLVCGHSEYELSGKKLLNIREDYPWLDLLINMFGADHFTVKAVVTVLNLLSKIKLVDAGLANDIDKYVKAKKAAA